MLNAMAGKSDDDPFTWNIPFDKLPDYAKSCEDTNLAGIAIGIPRNTLSEIATPVMAAFESAIASLGGLGANIKDETNIPSAKEHKELCEDEEFFVITAEFKSDLAAYFATLQNNHTSCPPWQTLLNSSRLIQRKSIQTATSKGSFGLRMMTAM